MESKLDFKNDDKGLAVELDGQDGRGEEELPYHGLSLNVEASGKLCYSSQGSYAIHNTTHLGIYDL